MIELTNSGLPSHEGSGLKYRGADVRQSEVPGLLSYEGSELKLSFENRRNGRISLPLHEGSGLKYLQALQGYARR